MGAWVKMWYPRGGLGCSTLLWVEWSTQDHYRYCKVEEPERLCHIFEASVCNGRVELLLQLRGTNYG